MSKEFNIDEIIKEFGWLNSFYNRKDVRPIIYSLFKGRCAATDARVDLECADIGHIVPQSDAAYFVSLFPGLDVHNLINLHLLDASQNRKVSNHFPKNPLMIYNAISYNIRLIRQRLPSILAQQTGPHSILDPQAEIERLRIPVDVDYSDLYEHAVCHGEYHRLDAGKARKKFESIVAAQNVSESDVLNFHDFGLKNDAHVFVYVEQGRLTGLSGKFLSIDEPHWADKLYRHYLSCRTENRPVDLPDGEYIFMNGSAASANRQYTLSLELRSRRSIIQALELLGSSQADPIPVGKVEGRPLVHIADDRDLYAAFQSQTHRQVLFGNATEQVPMPEKIYFLGRGGTAAEYEDIARKRALASDGNGGCLILKSDYNTLIRRTRKAVASDLERLSIARSPASSHRSLAPV